ncbi:MAG: FecR domain-containing protein [Pseudomonadota bacterium]
MSNDETTGNGGGGGDRGGDHGGHDPTGGGRPADAACDHAQALAPLTNLERERFPGPEFAHESAAAYQRFQMNVPPEVIFPTPAAPALRAFSRRRLPDWMVLPAAAIAALVIAVGVWRLNVSPPLSVVVSGGAVEEGGFVRAPELGEDGGRGGEPSLRFSDGTEVSLGPASRARVAATTRHGARVLLEDGRAQARVVPRKGADWVFDAGPCRVHVTGTRFDMRWAAPEQVLEVQLYDGTVTVKGPPAMAGVPMRAGQRLVMDVRHGSVRLTDLTVTSEAADSRTPPGLSAAAEPDGVPLAPGIPAGSGTIGMPGPPPATGARHGESWPARVLAGEFRAVTDEAERRGIDEVLRGESAANIMALADAARYAGASPLAQKALLKLRARFPRTAPAHKAAFLLGRIAEDQHGNLAKALDWYDTYLADAPDDAFRAEAMGRRMTATLHLSGPARARDLASEYIHRYPQGAYAQAARAILSP